ncbi:multiheme c-type cytochrome [Methanolobus sp. ZRKC3]|uniref:multiheme c-type cytochrome n=1 Tax=Methanolobus sp. ZRKC3 TaxID=3125786 RepID=UPI00324C09CA
MAIIFLAFCAHAAEPTTPGEYSSDEFTLTSKCTSCHAFAYSEWEGTMHSNAYVDPFYLKEVEAASKDTDGLVDTFCSRCHTPIGVVSEEIPPIDGSQMSEIAKEGVQCDFCHTVSGSTGVGNAPFIVTPGDTKWGPFDDSKSAFHESEYLELQTRSEFCGMCHEVIHPVNGLVIDDTYSTWKSGPYAQEDVSCQDCHMTPGITKFEANPGRAGSGAPKREHISLHSIVGGNAFITEMLGAGKEKQLAIERLQKAASLEIEVPDTAVAGEEVKVEVHITNSGAGHNIPTGVSEIRQIWLELKVTDSTEKEIYLTGNLDSSGNIAERTMVYNNVLGDEQGNETISFWLADRVLSDNRIGPKETVTEEYIFTLPENVNYPVLVEATLNYRSAPQELIDHLFEEGVHEVPVIDMAQASGNIYDPTDPGSGEEEAPGFVAFSTAITLLAITRLFKDK